MEDEDSVVLQQFGPIRPWHVFCGGLLLTVVALVLIPRPTPTYWGRAEVLMVPPNADNFGNGLRSDSGEAVMFAAALEREVNRVPTYARPASDDATLFGLGVREGVTVALSNGGGQWQASFARPVLVVQAVSSDPDRARAEFDHALARIETASVALQRSAEVPPAAAVRISVSPAQPAIVEVAGSRKRELAAEFLLGLGLSSALSIAWRRARAKADEAGDRVVSS